MAVYGTKRTTRVAALMSANDPKRTCRFFRCKAQAIGPLTASQRSHRLTARMVVVIARLEEKIISFGQVGEEPRRIREALQIFPAVFCFVLECEEEYPARSHYSPNASKAFLDELGGKMCENGVRQDEVEARIVEVSKECIARAAVDQSRSSCCEIFFPNEAVRIIDRSK